MNIVYATYLCLVRACDLCMYRVLYTSVYVQFVGCSQGEECFDDMDQFSIEIDFIVLVV